MDIHDKEGYCASLETRLEHLADERPVVLGRVVALLIKKAGGLTQGELLDCEVLDADEYIYED